MKLYLAVISSNIGMLSMGMFFGWVSPSLPLLLQGDNNIRLTLDQSSWVASVFTLGGALGVLPFTSIVNLIGRKNTMLFTVMPSLIGWMMIAFARTPWELYMSRFVSGIGCGIAYSVTPMYLCEISPAHMRGLFAAMLTVAAKLGTSVEFAIGPFLSVRNLALVSAVMPILFFVTFVWLPESPYYLMRRERKEEAIESLRQLRGTKDVSAEAEIIEKSVKADLANETGFRELLFVPGNRKALMVILGLVTMQQWSGSLAVLSYAQLVFDAADTDIEGKYLMIILGVLQVVCTIVSASTVDRFGRRPLLMFSTFGTAISTTVVGLYFYLEDIRADTSSIGWFPAAGLLLYIVTYCFGLAALPFIMIGEVFPTNVKALGSTIGVFTVNFWAFVVTVSYQSIADSFGVYSAFWLFSSCSLLGLIFVYLYVPETKGKTLQKIQEELHKCKA